MLALVLLLAASDMVKVPAGPFTRGCATCEDDARPEKEVNLPAFWIDRTEVTQKAWAACVKAKKCAVPKCAWDPKANPAFPVTCVTWAQAAGFCAWAGKRLPTEAEWEKAARGSDKRAFPWGADEPTCERANFSACGETVKAVGSLPAGASPSGALDMSGNAWEWTADWFDARGWERPPAKHEVRTVRGGGYVGETDMLRTTYRMGLAPEIAEPILGFRCVK